eukprot:gene10550-10710_t
MQPAASIVMPHGESWQSHPVAVAPFPPRTAAAAPPVTSAAAAASRPVISGELGPAWEVRSSDDVLPWILGGLRQVTPGGLLDLSHCHVALLWLGSTLASAAVAAAPPCLTGWAGLGWLNGFQLRELKGGLLILEPLRIALCENITSGQWLMPQLLGDAAAHKAYGPAPSVPDWMQLPKHLLLRYSYVPFIMKRLGTDTLVPLPKFPAKVLPQLAAAHLEEPAAAASGDEDEDEDAAPPDIGTHARQLLNEAFPPSGYLRRQSLRQNVRQPQQLRNRRRWHEEFDDSEETEEEEEDMQQGIRGIREG